MNGRTLDAEERRSASRGTAATATAAAAPAPMATRTAAWPHQLEAVHQLQQQQEQQHRNERDADAHRRILSEIIASRRGAKRSSSATAAPNDSVMSWFESTFSRTIDLPAEAGQRAADSRRCPRSSSGRSRTRPAAARSRRSRACRGAGTATAAGSTRPCPSRSSVPGSRSSSAPGRLSNVAVPLLVAVVDVVVAEPAEEEVGERRVAVARRQSPAAVRSQIDEWPSGSATPRSNEPRSDGKHVAVDDVGAEVHRPLASGLVVYVAERAADVGVGERGRRTSRASVTSTGTFW